VSADGTVGAKRRIGAGWSSLDLVSAGGDIDADGYPDVIARSRTTGELWLYPLKSGATWGTPHVIGSGFGNKDVVLGVGAWDGDSTGDVLAREASTGNLLLYPGNGPGRLMGPRLIGRGWDVMGTVISAGDFSGDGYNDLIAREKSGGRLLLYMGNGTGGFKGVETLANPATAQGVLW
jgi:hypothetical protein